VLHVLRDTERTQPAPMLARAETRRTSEPEFPAAHLRTLSGSLVDILL
jgi:hypothetical protein